jgi:dUTPase
MKRIYVNGGIIDPDYTGSVIVLLENRGVQEYVISSGDAIAQIILHEVRIPDSVRLVPFAPVIFKYIYNYYKYY